MGSDPSQDKWAYGNELPRHEVYLEAFSISAFPVTNQEYKQFVNATAYSPPKHWTDGEIPHGKEDHPVVMVDWFDAQAFCRWANARLPTEPEWEKAARGTDQRLFPWGHQNPTRKRCNQCLFFGDTTPVSMFPEGRSPYGVWDMAGNVWEWTSTLAASYPHDPSDGREDPEAIGFRVLRGGGFRTVNRVRCAFRDVGTYPDDPQPFRGFRVVGTE